MRQKVFSLLLCALLGTGFAQNLTVFVKRRVAICLAQSVAGAALKLTNPAK